MYQQQNQPKAPQNNHNSAHQQPQSQPVIWKPWNPNANAFPKPDLQAYQLKQCYGCKGTAMGIVESVNQYGTRKFRADCSACGKQSGDLPYAQDVQSLAANQFFFGAHKGQTFGQVQTEDPNYFSWCLDNLTDVRLLGTILLYQRALNNASGAV